MLCDSWIHLVANEFGWSCPVTGNVQAVVTEVEILQFRRKSVHPGVLIANFDSCLALGFDGKGSCLFS